MPVDSTHIFYDEFLVKWSRARDVLAGEDALKAAGEAYIPRLDAQNEEEYLAYVQRSSFFNATARTSDGFSGQIFRRDPVLKIPGGSDFERFQADADMLGTSFMAYVKRSVTDVLGVGRSGTLVEWNDEEARPFLCAYRAEQIINWRMVRLNGRMVLGLLVLMESGEATEGEDFFELESVPQIRVLKLVPAVGSAAGVELVVEIWRADEGKDSQGRKEWKLVETIKPRRRGQRLQAIPFVFHGPYDSLPDPAKPPLEDILTVNLAHFRLDAEYKHGLHFTALPTAWVSGFNSDATLRIGSTVAWVTEQVGATAGFLEFKGEGLQTFERAMDRLERIMAILGSRMLESQKRVSESAEALSLRQAAESSVVANIAGSQGRSLTQILQWVHWWLDSGEKEPEKIPADVVSIELNRDFETATMTAPELIATVQAWQSGLISHDSALNLLRQGEIIPTNRTNAEEIERIEAQLPPMLAQLPAKTAKLPAGDDE